jgi:hypothetical protein
MDMAKGRFRAGMHVSFIGNASDGALKPWTTESKATDLKTNICDFQEGSISAPLMLEKERYTANWGFVTVMFSMFGFLVWSAACLFYPDGDTATCGSDINPEQFLRIMQLAAVAMFMSCIGGLFVFFLGPTGKLVGAIFIALLLTACCSQEFLERTKQCCERRPEDSNDPEQPLLAENTSASQHRDGQLAEEQPEAELISEEQPVTTQSSTAPGYGSLPTNEVEYPEEAAPSQQASSGSLLTAAILGIIAGILGAIFVSVAIAAAAK